MLQQMKSPHLHGNNASHSSGGLSITKVRELLDRHLADSNQSTWSRPLIFRCIVVSPGESPSDRLISEENLSKFTEPVYKGFKLYFDSQQYKPAGTTRIDPKDPSWKLLCADLMRSARDTAGMDIVANGQEGCGYRKLICQRGTFCDKRTVAKSFADDSDGKYRETTLNADYRNVRTNGKTLHRRTTTTKPIVDNGSTTCKWKLVFSCDVHGFYLRCGVGCGTHQGHAPPLENALSSTRISLLEQSDIDTLKCLGGSQANAGVGRNYYYNKTGKFISTSQVRYIFSEPWKLPRPTDGARPLEDIDLSTPPCKLLDHFRNRNDICYSCLFSDASSAGPGEFCIPAIASCILVYVVPHSVFETHSR